MPSVDPVFAIDEFKEPKYLSTTETLVNNMLILLLGEPGFYPSLPSIGLNIKQYFYMPINDVPCTAIKKELGVQCRDFLPQIESGEFDIQKSLYNNNVILLITFPVIDDTHRNTVSLGITINENGEFVYNFVEGKYQTL